MAAAEGSGPRHRLVSAIIAVAAAAIGISVWSLLAPGRACGPEPWPRAWSRWRWSGRGVGQPGGQRQGAFDTPFEPARTAEAVEQARHMVAAFSIAALQGPQESAPYLMAAQTVVVPSLVIYDSGLEALPIGG